MWKKVIFTLGISIAVVAGAGIPAVTQPVSAQEIVNVKSTTSVSQAVFSPTSDWGRFGFDNFFGDNLTSDGFVSDNTKELTISRFDNMGYGEVNLVDDRGITINTWYFRKGDIQSSIHLNSPLINGKHYSVMFYLNGGQPTTIAYFEVKDNTSSHHPPIIEASSRTVMKDDSTFNILDGVSAHDEDGVDITGDIQVQGDVDIHKAETYPVTYSVTDKNGLLSRKSIDISVKDNGNSLTPPTLDIVTDDDKTITGKGVPNTTVFIILGTSPDKYKTAIQSDGTFSLTLEHPYPVGTSITAYVEDGQGNKSDSVYGVVQSGVVNIGVNKIVSSDTFVTGYATPNAEIEVSVNNTRSHIFTGLADETGKYKISMNDLSYSAGTSIDVKATINNQSSSKSVIVYPKKVSVNSLKVGDDIVSGKGDPSSIVNLAIQSKEYQFNTDNSGNFSGEIASPLNKGDRVIASQISNNIKSDEITVYIN